MYVKKKQYLCGLKWKLSAMRHYIPSYFNTKQNIILLLWVTLVFGELFILFFQPVESRTWVESDWAYLLWVTIIVLVAVGGIAVSRTIMYHYAKKHRISYLDFAFWIKPAIICSRFATHH